MQLENTDDILDIDKLASFYEDLNRENIIIVHHGMVNQELVRAFLSLAREKFRNTGDKKVVKKRVFNIMVECLQNINRHNLEVPNEKSMSSIFMIGIEDQDYFIITGNIMMKKNVADLEKQLVNINTLDEAGISDQYAAVIKGGRIHERGGAGLGLLDIARRSAQELVYSFREIDDKYSFFSLLTRVRRELKE